MENELNVVVKSLEADRMGSSQASSDFASESGTNFLHLRKKITTAVIRAYSVIHLWKSVCRARKGRAPKLASYALDLFFSPAHDHTEKINSLQSWRNSTVAAKNVP